MDTLKLKDTLTGIMEKAVRDEYVAGVGVLVCKDGKELVSAEAGYRNAGKKLPVTKDTIYRLYSMSKPITSAAVMILMERGMVDLGDPVSMYIPGFRNQTYWENGARVPVKREATLRDLLSMTSGLPYGMPTPAGEAAAAVFEDVIARLDGERAASTVEIADTLGRLPLEFSPGEHFMYGTSADILGAVVEIVSGMKFGEFLKKEIFDPLQMNDTGFYVEKEKLDRVSATYLEMPEGGLTEDHTRHLGIPYWPVSAPAFESGGAGLISTLPDYMKFASMLLSGGTCPGGVILKPATVRFMTKGALRSWQQTDLEKGWDGLTGYTYGNLMRVMRDPGRAMMLVTEGEYGWDGWLGTYFSNHPAEKLTILIGLQKENCGTCSLTRKIRNVVLSALED